MSKVDLWKEIDKLREERTSLREELENLKEENELLETQLQVLCDWVDQSVSEKKEYTPYEFSERGGEDETDIS